MRGLGWVGERERDQPGQGRGGNGPIGSEIDPGLQTCPSNVSKSVDS